jgi:hypothetical protein
MIIVIKIVENDYRKMQQKAYIVTNITCWQ